jgi:hypothetical protein
MNDTLRLRLAHASMQFSDTAKQQAHDVNVVFNRGYDIITGTESGPDNALHGLVLRAAPDSGYRLAAFRSQWVAFRADLITGGWRKGYVPSVESTEGVGRHPDRGIVWGSGNVKGFGRVTAGAGHLLTHGEKPGDPNYRLNTRYARDIGEWGAEAASGNKIVFYGGDQNSNDAVRDTFRGKPFTSCWDELGKHPGTHGKRTIDVLASHDTDRRVKCVSARVLRDSQVFLNTDHFLIEAVYEVKPKRITR